MKQPGSNSYIVTFTLISNANYQTLSDAIKTYGTWANITGNTWAIVTNQTSQQVRDYLIKFITQGDRLFVIKSGYESAWFNVICKSDWLKENL